MYDDNDPYRTIGRWQDFDGSRRNDACLQIIHGK